MADLLKEHCHALGLEYILIWGRFTPILYRADKFELVDSAFCYKVLGHPKESENMMYIFPACNGIRQNYPKKREAKLFYG